MRNYNDILPQTWNVVTLTISSDHKEFVISKLRSNQTPFVLRLPFRRGDEEDDDEAEFGFDEGKEELKEIITEANRSAHDSKTRNDKYSKKEWWAYRQALDNRLKNLLQNIESVWLGGFRGIFSEKPIDPDLLSRFITSFERILDKHLPSRRQRGKNKSQRPKFDQSVMELFVNIGDIDSEADPDELVMDLLYFVVDILQFYGERNAYDEIDFDMMVVDTLDAIKSYKTAQQAEAAIPETGHTILILDKKLHSFPWESLPCLQNSSVSRMPSLHSLRERILEMEAQKAKIQGIQIDRRNGSYILNPSGDLKSTETSFSEPLSRLEGWSGIVNREPAEQEFKDSLEEKDLLLYFGHGSGAQFIRGRTIKRLDRCAVAFLMGCSSGTLTEAGEFEPYGTPMNYIQAGSSALVATLWDVTDKDIDRFAQSTFETWGLMDQSNSKETAVESSRSSRSRRGRQGQSKKGTPSSSEREKGGSIGLDTAVANARSACFLKYLNGAAPVVYGVPVFLG